MEALFTVETDRVYLSWGPARNKNAGIAGRPGFCSWTPCATQASGGRAIFKSLAQFRTGCRGKTRSRQ